MRKTLPSKLCMLYLIFVALLSSVASSFGQYWNIRIDNEGNPCEPSICINPKAPNIMVGGSVLNNVYYSDDFGKSWKTKTLTSKFGVFGDPCVIADNEGSFYYFHLSDPEKTGWQSDLLMDRIVCQKSKNGKRWHRGRSIGHNPPKQQDKEWATFDEFSGNIYVTWTQFDDYGSEDPSDSSHIMFSYSDDRGRSFKPAIRINQIGGDCQDGDQTVEGAVPATGPGGKLYVAWSLNEKIYFDKSADGGISWLKSDKVIADQPGGWSFEIPGIGRCNGFPVVDCDVSYGPHHGTIYVSWTDQRNGANDTDVWLIKSTDEGETWSEPKRINNDQTGNHQFFSWMCVDPVTGYIYLVFYDRRNLEENMTEVYMAYSTDGGATFKNEKISETPFEPIEGVFFGDYNNISAYAGYVRPVWTRMENGQNSIWTAIVDIP